MRLLMGKPMLQYTIEAAQNSGVSPTVLVSSDDDASLALAERMGATALPRPAELATDTTRMNDVVEHAWASHPSQHMVLLYATAPLRDAVHIREAWNLYREKSTGTLISITELKTAPWGGVLRDENAVLSHLAPNSAYRRQDMPGLYRANGAIYVFDQPTFPTLTGMMMNQSTVGYVMPNDRSVDVDTVVDFALAEFLLKEGYVSLRNLSAVSAAG